MADSTAQSYVYEPGKTKPTTLYKYFPPERISVLEQLELRFSRPAEFNDVFDTQFLLPKGSGAVAERFRLRNEVGILCLTERDDNHLMWVHYARNHTGFVLGFKAYAPFFSDNERELKKVIYKTRPQVLAEADPGACFYKSQVWKYEEEWRCIRRFKSAEARMVSFDPSLVTHIIFGSGMESHHVTALVRVAAILEMNHVTFMLSKASQQAHVFLNIPQTISVCDKCDGEGHIKTETQSA
ncbi:MAG TPA: DUF2971 domain-containing protein [Bryobacteraceae bacterium]|jgi:hypothetical protein